MRKDVLERLTTQLATISGCGSLFRNLPKAPMPVLEITADLPPSLETQTAMSAGEPPRYR
jgi:hypothetical protein